MVLPLRAVLLVVLLVGCEARISSLEPSAAIEETDDGPKGLEFDCQDSGALGPALARRLTLPEYAQSLKDTLGVDITTDAAAQLPRDLRADGFDNSTDALIVSLDHMQAYANLAELAVSRMTDRAAWATSLSSCSEMTRACATAFIDAAGLRVFRAPLSSEERAALLTVFDAAAAESADFAETTGLLLEAMLQSPRFLYRTEAHVGTGRTRALESYELASRLSYLVWGSSPDERLLSLAAQGKLTSDEELQAELSRMLADARAEAQMVRYIDQWLNLGRLDNLVRDPQQFPGWNPALGLDMKEETRALFRALWAERLPLQSAFNMERTTVSPALAAHYGLGEGDGSGAYDLTAIPERGGLLTHGSLLTIGGNHASMVTRGLFVLENLMCRHISSPPAGVDTTPPEVKAGASQRVHSEARVANSTCRGCHVQFEPIVWGLERFDATGSYATVDPHGNALLEDGYVVAPLSGETHPYASVQELNTLLAEDARVKECLALKAVQFSFGRKPVEQDACSLAQTRKHYWNSNGSYQDLLAAIVLSPQFRSISLEEGQ